ncbi:hypothetical protein RI054_28g114120 [Pseudoscourfieldia marina]
MSPEEASSMLLARARTFVGQRVKLVHLSEKSAHLNGRTGEVVGHGGIEAATAAIAGGPFYRLHVKLDPEATEEGQPTKVVKCRNVQQAVHAGGWPDRDVASVPGATQHKRRKTNSVWLRWYSTVQPNCL